MVGAAGKLGTEAVPIKHGIREVLERDMCIGCGACQIASGRAVSIRLTSHGIFRASLGKAPQEAIQAASRVCPFSDDSPNEDHLGAPRGTPRMVKDPMLGDVSATWAGWVSDDEERVRSSSGGLTSWVLARALTDGMADAVVSVGHQHRVGKELFDYGIAESEQLSSLRKSQYYATSMADVLELIESTDRRYVLVAVPCFIRAARALCLERPALAERITLFVSLICGHYKTRAYGESLAWQVGVHPDTLDRVDFRVKDLSARADRYGFGAGASDVDVDVVAANTSLRGTNWGLNVFQPEACNFCDDVVGETADISLGDAWLPEFVRDPRGTNVVISRNEDLDAMFAAGERRGEITLRAVTTHDVIDSQAGGFRHRREGLAVRLADDKAAGLSVPRKRVSPDAAKAVSKRRRMLLRHRRAIAAASHGVYAQARERDDVGVFTRWLDAKAAQYRRLEAPLLVRILRMVRPAVAKTLRRALGRRPSGRTVWPGDRNQVSSCAQQMGGHLV